MKHINKLCSILGVSEDLSILDERYNEIFKKFRNLSLKKERMIKEEACGQDNGKAEETREEWENIFMKFEAACENFFRGLDFLEENCVITYEEAKDIRETVQEKIDEGLDVLINQKGSACCLPDRYRSMIGSKTRDDYICIRGNQAVLEDDAEPVDFDTVSAEHDERLLEIIGNALVSLDIKERFIMIQFLNNVTERDWEAATIACCRNWAITAADVKRTIKAFQERCRAAA